MNDSRDWKFKYPAETIMMLGIFNPWTVKDTEVFKRAITYTGQVSIGIREVLITENNECTVEEIQDQIKAELEPLGFFEGKHYIVGQVPNIVRMFAGPDKDYKDTQTMLDTPPPDSVFKTAELKDPWAGDESLIHVDQFNNKAQKHEEAEDEFPTSNMRHEDWPEG